MLILQIVVLALIQGITEFLPISSSGHLLLVPALTGWPDQGSSFHGSVPSEEGAMRYFIDTCRWARQDGVEVFYFAAFDEAWKVGAVNPLYVATGGAILDGMPEIAEQIFDLPIRRGCPTGVGGLADHPKPAVTVKCRPDQRPHRG